MKKEKNMTENIADKEMSECKLCPRNCKKNRKNKEKGYCLMTDELCVARAALHMWEEPVISGTQGSGTVFFSGCNLHCVFCQNYDISCNGFGKEITIERLKEIYHELIAQGAHNINLVTPTHFTEAVLQSLDEPLPVPVVYNTSGFETQDTLRRLKGKVQIYLPDLKYSDDMAAIKYSNAPYYFRIATEAIKEMYNQVGDYHIDDNGIIQEAKFKTFGCGAAVATSSMATELVKGKTIQQALEVTNKAVMEALDGLPPVKVHCSLLAEEAIHAALWDYAEKNGIKIEGLEKPKTDISEGEEEEEY